MDTSKHSALKFIELGVGSAEGIGEFFSSVFGWSFSEMGDGGQGWFDLPGLKIGVHGGDPDSGFVPYFKVADIEAAIEKVREAGGSADDRIAEEEGFGRFCNCQGPSGVKFGLHQP